MNGYEAHDYGVSCGIQPEVNIGMGGIGDEGCHSDGGTAYSSEGGPSDSMVDRDIGMWTEGITGMNMDG